MSAHEVAFPESDRVFALVAPARSGAPASYDGSLKRTSLTRFSEAGVVGAFFATALALGAADRVPVLLELFTSEGCSSCPPADLLLESLDREQPAPGAELIVLSEHVDYWNQLGWADPYSSSLFSARQREYSHRLGLSEVYTPQLVIDGHAEFVGSDRGRALQVIEDSIHRPKLGLSITASRSATAATVRVTTDRPGHKADLYIVLASDHARSQVSRGENAGHLLTHVAVAYSITRVANWDSDIPIKPRPGLTRVIAILQDRDSARILGVAQAGI